MKIAFFSTKPYEKKFFNRIQHSHQISYFEAGLNLKTASLAKDHPAVCCFVTDTLDAATIKALAQQSVQLIAFRMAGYDHVDLAAAKQHQITVVRVPKYSPQAIAEFATGLILTLARHIVMANQQVQAGNFALDNLLGFNLYQKTIGIIGTGNIGTAFAKIMLGFGCRVIANDPLPFAECQTLGVQYVDIAALYQQSDIISLHCPLNDDTYHIIDAQALQQMKQDVMIINTGRGALIDTPALINALKANHVGYAGLDVYEKEKGIFFIDHHDNKLSDNDLLTLQSMTNVLITPHQAFFTADALMNITQTTISNITAFETGYMTNAIK